MTDEKSINHEQLNLEQIKIASTKAQPASQSYFGYNQSIIRMQLKTLNPLPTSNQTLETSSEMQKPVTFRSHSHNPFAPDLPRYKSFIKLMLQIMVVGISSFYFGYVIVYMSTVDFLTVISVYHVTLNPSLAKGILVACVPVGGAVGAVLSGFFIERFSRRRNVLMANLVAFLTGFLIFVPHFQTFVVARLLQGVVVGFSSSLAPLIMKETSPREISGTLTSFHQIFSAFGIFFAFIFSLFVSLLMNDSTGKRTWWFIFGLPQVLIALQTLLLMFVYPYQTPKYLFEKDEQTRGRLLVERVYKPQYVEEVIREIKINLGKQVVYNSAEDKSETFTLSINEPSFDQNHRRTPRSAIIMAIHLAALQQFCGINIVAVYGSQIVGGDDQNLRLMVPILINLEQVVAAIFASYFLTVVGRKPLLEIGTIVSFLGCGLIAGGLFLQKIQPGIAYVLILFGLVLFMANFGFTLGPVIWVYLSEIVQPKVFPYATTANWISAALVMLLFPVIRETLPNKNGGYLFLFFALWSTLSYFFNKRFLIETQNKEEKQILEEFRVGREIKQY